MRFKAKLAVHKTYNFLKEAMPVASFLALLFFIPATIGLLKDTKTIAQDTNRIAEDTQVIVSKQDETLKAIEELAVDNKISGKELKDVLLCMLIVPIEQRNSNTKERCRDEARRNAVQDAADVMSSTSPKPSERKSAQPQQPQEPPSDDAVDLPLIDLPLCLPLDLLCVK